MTDPDVKLFRVLMSPRAKLEAARILDSGYVGEGPEALAFEKDLATSLGVTPQEVMSVNSCTSAITLALHLAGVGPGDEVVTSPMTCAATNCPIVTRGARPVWADIDPRTGLIVPADVARKIGPRTRAIITVDWGGRSCDYAALRKVAKGIPVIQDAAQRAPFRLPEVHERADYVCLSFQAIKFVTCCDGGALVCNPKDAERARLLRWYGLDRRLDGDARVRQPIRDAGYKFHMNDLAAGIGRANLPQAEWAVGRHREHAARYDRELANVPTVVLPPPDPEAHFWLYTVLADEPDRFIEHLASHGIEASRVHMRNDNHPALGAPPEPLPGVDEFASHEVAIPVGWWLEERDLIRVIDAVKSFGERRRAASA